MIYKCQECGKRFFALRNYTAHVEGHVEVKREARFERAKQERLEVNKERFSSSRTNLTNSEDYKQTAINTLSLSPLYQSEISSSNSVHGSVHIQSDDCHRHANVESPLYTSQTESYSSDSSCSNDSSSSPSSYE